MKDDGIYVDTNGFVYDKEVVDNNPELFTSKACQKLDSSLCEEEVVKNNPELFK